MRAADEEGFLGRWSRRKRETQAEDPPPAPVAEEAPAVEPEPVLELPDIETLGRGSDYKPFLQAGVPVELQRLALRKLWRSNPVLANLDGLVDYADDYTDAGTVRPNMRTVYKVARLAADALQPEDGGAAADTREPAEGDTIVAEEDEHAGEEDEHAREEDDKPLAPPEQAI